MPYMDHMGMIMRCVRALKVDEDQSYPPVIMATENPPFMNDFPSQKLHLHGISQPAMFEDTEGYPLLFFRRCSTRGIGLPPQVEQMQIEKLLEQQLGGSRVAATERIPS